MRNCFLILLVFFSINKLSAQIENRDSLLKLLPAVKEDTAAVWLYLHIGETYEASEPEIAKQYFKKARLLGEKINYYTGLDKSFRYFSGVFLIQSKYDSALLFSEKALRMARERKDSLRIGIALFNTGIVYRFMADYETAIVYSLEGAKILEKINQKSISSQVNNGLQNLYMSLGQYDNAIKFGELAVQQSRELNNDNFLAVALNNLALSYMERDSLLGKAKAVLLEANKIAKKTGNLSIGGAALNNLADIAIRENKYELLKEYAGQALLLHKQIGSAEGEAISLRAHAIYYLHKRNFNKAKEYAGNSLKINKENDYKLEMASCLKVLSNIAFAMGDIESGNSYFVQSEKIFETILNESVSKKETELKARYENEKKEDKIKQLEAEKKVQQLSIKQKNTLNYILIGGAATLLIISLLSYRTYKQKQKLQQQRITELETQQQLTATEAVLKGEEQERTRLAKDLHDGLGGMLSGIKYSLNTMKGNLIMTTDNAQVFERSMDMLDSSIKEMRRVAHNMMPEALVKFGLDTALKDFCNDINKTGALEVSYQSIGIEDAAIEQTTAITIYRIVQELINNTMKHAAAKHAIVQVAKSDHQLTVTVEDDGKGFDTAIIKGTGGIGWANIQHRVEFLKGKLDVNSEPGKGTSVLIELNV